MIYKITNNVNNKCIVGKTTQKLMRRWIQHRCMLRINRHNNKHLQDAWNKYGNIYDNMTEASRAIGSQPGNIRKQIKGLIKHNKGFVFKEVISEGGE